MSRADSAAAAALVLAGVRRPGADAAVDVHVVDGTVRAIVPAGATPDADVAAATSDAERLDLDGRWIVPGLWDRHVHMAQWAMAARRIDLAAVGSAAQAAELVAAAVRDGADEVVGMGYRDGLWPDRQRIDLLDGVSGDVPVVLVSGDLHSCWVNSAAARRHGLLEQAGASGVLREDDCFRLVRELDDVADAVLDAWVADAARAAAARGVVGVVDYEMRWNRDDWARRASGGLDALRVRFGVYTQHLERAAEAGLRTGDPVERTRGLVHVGGYKVITDGSLNTRTAWCVDAYPGLAPDEHPYGVANVPYDELVPHLRRAREIGLEPAVHAIGDRANERALDALEAVQPSGWHGRASIEHAQLLRREDLARFARLGVVASVQPEHAMDDRDVAERYWAGRTDRAFMLRDLSAAGVELALGSDAPVAPLDPWVAIAAAVGRTRDGREPWHPEQAVDVRIALAGSTDGAGVDVRDGLAADLVVVDRDPVAAPADQLRGMPVALTLLGGRVTHDGR
ncbi:amidohydrolase [Agromyces aurantiacus]|uniref:Amidohydrolase n=1 Tax=Agromyces aurantiacus TaxID=165814 RepID=A0ABV9R7K3_9MICO|nr:amidohydrolase family protein [Agromyces aurantiacus]MBM7504974.1 putative amidohydrolase YtcJ [Agromyces aurantiacus]